MDDPRQTSWPARLRALIIAISWFLAAMFLIAGFGKVINPDPFLKLLVFLTPDSLSGLDAYWWVGGGVVAVEVFLGVALLLAPPPRLILALALAAIFAFTLVLLRIASSPDAPACGCLGLLAVANQAAQPPAQGIVRNLAMGTMLVWLWRQRVTRVSGTDIPAIRPQAGSIRRGFALVELLVCIAVVSVLLALLTPALGKVRASAHLAASVSMNRQLVACTALYSADYDAGFPFLGTPGQPFGPIMAGGKNVSWNGYFRDQGLFWMTQMVPNYYSGPRSAIESLTEDGKPNNQPWGEPVILSHFHLSHTIFARPEFWSDRPANASVHRWDWSLLRGTGQHDVRFPSDKGLIVDVSIGWLRGQGEGPDVGPIMSAGFADGSSAAPIVTPSGMDSVVVRPLAAHPVPVFSTRDGLAGRDRR